MKTVEIVAYSHADGFVVCLGCLTVKEWRDGQNNQDTLWHPVFVGDEWDVYPSCDRCLDQIDDVTLIHSEPTIDSALAHYMRLYLAGMDRHNGLEAMLKVWGG